MCAKWHMLHVKTFCRNLALFEMVKPNAVFEDDLPLSCQGSVLSKCMTVCTYCCILDHPNRCVGFCFDEAECDCSLLCMRKQFLFPLLLVVDVVMHTFGISYLSQLDAAMDTTRSKKRTPDYRIGFHWHLRNEIPCFIKISSPSKKIHHT